MQNLTPKNLAIFLFTAVMMLGGGAALAASSDASSQNSGTGLDNQSGSEGAKQNLPPNNVNNNKINNSGTDMSSGQSDSQGVCQGGNCPDNTTPSSNQSDTKTE
ncbi:protein YbgS [Martelella alba]|uniref:Uncharacterized protein n=1 Tax=Martelella alba TaxID=2590451 RepID=A0ABY2SN71_9HYPH|nr:protein YbgS [Martelella alba]TKI07384.1 hypothetical protein FCN80_05690 [Martelella alba]